MKKEDPHNESPLRHLWQMVVNEKRDIFVVLTYGVGLGMLSLTIPIGMQTVVNSVAFTSVSQPILFLVIAVLAGQTLAAFFRILQVIVVEKLQKRIFTHVALELSYRLARIQRSLLPNRPAELVNRFFEVMTIQKSISTLLLEGFALALQTTIGLVLLAFYHPALLAFDILLLGAILFVFFVLGKGATKTAIQESVEKYKVIAWLEEVAAKGITFSFHTGRDLAISRTDDILVNYLKARNNHFSIVMRQVVGLLSLQAVASAALLGLGLYLIIKNQLSLGQLVAAEIIVSNVLYSLVRFQKHLDAFYDLLTALHKLDGLLELPLEKSQSSGEWTVSQKSGISVEFRKTTYQFGEQSSPIDKISLKINPGEHTLLVGENGSWKSTVIDLIYGSLAPTSGIILLNNTDTRALSPEDIRTQVALVRKPEIISGSLIENITLQKNKSNLDEVKKSLFKVGLLNSLLSLPNGLDTELNESGSPLSITQCHLLLVARAIHRTPKLLLLDESLDLLDLKSRELLLRMLLTKENPWTVIATSSHRNYAKHFEKTFLLGFEKNKKGAV